MKKIIILLTMSLAFNLNAQDLKSLTKSAESITKTSGTSSFLEKFAGEQVTKLTKKLKLSDKQQKQVNDLVVSQLKSDKVQKLISSFSSDQLMSSDTQNQISKTIMSNDSFKSGMDNILTEEQKQIKL